MMKNDKRQQVVYGLLFSALCLCLWIGWSDYEFVKPDITQEEIRESIRSNIRTAFQLIVQFVLPILIVIYFVKQFINRKKQ